MYITKYVLKANDSLYVAYLFKKGTYLQLPDISYGFQNARRWCYIFVYYGNMLQPATRPSDTQTGAELEIPLKLQAVWCFFRCAGYQKARKRKQKLIIHFSIYMFPF